MSQKRKIAPYKTLRRLVTRLRDDLNAHNFVLLYAHNAIGKTRLSMEFKERGKHGREDQRDTLYYNAFTEDLFYWYNDIDYDINRHLVMNSKSLFFKGIKDLALEDKILSYTERYADFNFKIDYDDWKVTFEKQIKNPRYRQGSEEPEFIIQDNIKISRGEESMFVWCFFLAVVELTIDGHEDYDWIKYIYIDDPISSLDDNNVIAMACDLAKLLKTSEGNIKTVVSTHHTLFFNVMCNELKNKNLIRYFLSKNSAEVLLLQKTNDTPYFHHVALLSELKEAIKADKLNTYHFNALRSVFEKTATFFGYDDFGACLKDAIDEALYNRLLNIFSHGSYSVFNSVEMVSDNKKLFEEILDAFLNKYKFAVQ